MQTPNLGSRGNARPGRPFDHSTDALILTTTLDLLSERPYERVTLDGVAARTGKAKTTLYRRWATKDDLVVAAINSIGAPPEIDHPPDRGSLRSDLLSVIDSPWLGGPDRRLTILTGLAAAARSSQPVADAVRSKVATPYLEIYRSILERAVDRGQVPRERAPAFPLLAEVIPAMSTHRLNTGQGPVNRAFFAALIDDVMLPALR
ncbi:TetR/AcrR family transcriptional regulator [Rhodococcus sp. IEGM 1381]|uniref:TetR/AcrR family transcriptional regulator n=1 Tax=Rhodococcus sp. IEGM 1381 TaxID=3047085 RepID=UPI0024B6C2BE|nr:TetR/AcrR family transcriptional regulator [Rhodococcus sp. IEGM 1381]MDI9896459.1 TetR/AcrR family transcriptional regulator [Rhodococcus sp. IEGM 1381]